MSDQLERLLAILEELRDAGEAARAAESAAATDDARAAAETEAADAVRRDAAATRRREVTSSEACRRRPDDRDQRPRQVRQLLMEPKGQPISARRARPDAILHHPSLILRLLSPLL